MKLFHFINTAVALDHLKVSPQRAVLCGRSRNKIIALCSYENSRFFLAATTFFFFRLHYCSTVYIIIAQLVGFWRDYFRRSVCVCLAIQFALELDLLCQNLRAKKWFKTGLQASIPSVYSPTLNKKLI